MCDTLNSNSMFIDVRLARSYLRESVRPALTAAECALFRKIALAWLVRGKKGNSLSYRENPAIKYRERFQKPKQVLSKRAMHAAAVEATFGVKGAALTALQVQSAGMREGAA